MTNTNRHKHVVVLSGGGGYSAFGVGVMVDIFGGEDMAEADGVSVMMASAAIPGFFPLVNVKGEPAVDGGVVRINCLGGSSRG